MKNGITPTADASRHTPAPTEVTIIVNENGDFTLHNAYFPDGPIAVVSPQYPQDDGLRSEGAEQKIARHIHDCVNAHARLTRQADAAEGLRDQLEAVAAELRLRPTDPRSYSLDSYLPEKMHDPILAALVAYEEASK